MVWLSKRQHQRQITVNEKKKDDISFCRLCDSISSVFRSLPADQYFVKISRKEMGEFTDVIRRNYPDRFVFSIHETKTRNVLEDVRSMKSEVGIISFSGANEGIIKKLIREYGLTFTTLMRRETYIYVWEDHEFAGRSEISIEEMKEYPCVSFDQTDDSNFYLTEEAMADYDFDKLIKSEDRATSMELIANLHGYAVGSGMLADDKSILEGLVSIKLKEEDPLTIGYIVRKGSGMSFYGKAYIEELLKYKEL